MRILIALSILLIATVARGGEINSELAAIWNDATFQKQFVGSYGINADIEPRVTPEEVKSLEKVRPLMADALPKAEETLRKQMETLNKQTKGECSAILDFTLGGILFQQDKMIDALVSYRNAVKKFPSFRRAYRNIGLIQARNGVYDEAIEAFTKMIELGGGDAYSYGLLGFAYASKQDHQAAEAAYSNALLLQPENTEWRLGLTRCVYRQEKFEDAATLLDGLIERYPHQVDFWLLQAHSFLGMKQPLKAAENLEAIDRLNKSTADSLHTLGDIYVAEDLMDLALRAYLRAIEVDEKKAVAKPLRSIEVMAARGGLSQVRRLAARLHEAWDDQLEDADRTRLLKIEARLSLAEGGGDSETARVLEEIVQINPLDGEALMLLGQHYAKSGEPDRAIFYYERAESIESFEVTAKIRHAQVLVSMGRYADAVPLLRSAQEIKPRDDIARYLDQVDRIAKSQR